MQLKTGTILPSIPSRRLIDACAALLAQVLRFEQPADAVLSQFMQDRSVRDALGSRDRPRLGDAVYRVVRQKRRLEALAAHGPDSVGDRMHRLAWLSLLGFEAQGPGTAGSAQLVSALGAQGVTWLDGARAALQLPPSQLPPAERHNLPDWLVDELQAALGEAFWAHVDSLVMPVGLDLRVNLLHRKRAEVQKLLAQRGHEAQPTPYSPWGLRLNARPALQDLDLFAAGDIEVQDEGSQLLALLVDARRGEMVCDYCAGAGGKTLAMGAAMRNTGRLYALDSAAQRLQALTPRLARSGLDNVYPLAISEGRDERLQRLLGKMDRVLVDAPCSGLGTLRRSPDLAWRQSPASVADAARRQQTILREAAQLVKPGGRLVYATCSVLSTENEDIAHAFSEAHRDFAPVQADEILDKLKVPQASALCAADSAGAFLRLWPHLHHTDGFFAAVWHRR